MIEKLNNYIDGKWIEDGERRFSLNPSTNEEVYSYQLTSFDEICKVVEVARKSFEGWRKISRVKRAEFFDNLAQLIKQNIDTLAKIISIETGKNLNESKAEVLETLHMIQYVVGTGRQACGHLIASELSNKESYVMRKPKGVIAVISPHNFPAAIGSAWASAPAILEGNCVVHKPSELTPGTANFIAKLYHLAGFPAGVYNLINGAEETGRNLVESSVNCILFTGSSGVGRYIRKHCAGVWNKSCSCEQGGKSAVIIFDDANLDMSIEASMASAFKLSGQRCVSSGRLLIQRNFIDKFTEQFLTHVNNIKIGDPFECLSGFSYGPLISREQIKRVEYFNQLVRNDSQAFVLYDPDGTEGKINRPGNFIRPFVYRTEWRDMEYLKEEVFGPHVALIPFNDVDDAIRIYNDTEYGLSLGVITENFRNMREIRDNCNSGMIYLNGGSVAAESHLPFGGLGKSGYGHKTAAGTYRAVTDEIAVTINYDDKLNFPQGLK